MFNGTLNSVSQEIFQDALGLCRQDSNFWAYTAMSAAINIGVTKAYGYAAGLDKVVQTKISNPFENGGSMSSLEIQRAGYSRDLIGTLQKEGARFYSLSGGGHSGYLATGSAFATKGFAARFLNAIGFKHTSIVMDGIVSQSSIFGNGDIYGLFGVCHQRANEALFSAGVSNLMVSMNGTGAFTYLTYALHGPHGNPAIAQQIYNDVK